MKSSHPTDNWDFSNSPELANLEKLWPTAKAVLAHLGVEEDRLDSFSPSKSIRDMLAAESHLRLAANPWDVDPKVCFDAFIYNSREASVPVLISLTRQGRLDLTFRCEGDEPTDDVQRLGLQISANSRVEGLIELDCRLPNGKAVKLDDLIQGTSPDSSLSQETIQVLRQLLKFKHAGATDTADQAHRPPAGFSLEDVQGHSRPA